MLIITASEKIHHQIKITSSMNSFHSFIVITLPTTVRKTFTVLLRFHSHHRHPHPTISFTGFAIVLIFQTYQSPFHHLHLIYLISAKSFMSRCRQTHLHRSISQ